MTEIAQIVPDLFAEHAAALRRLARSLLRDPHEAEDALQETWVVALSRRPARLTRVRGWLETVLRNVVRKRRRAERRRRGREHVRARVERTESTLSAVARRQTLRAVTDAVLALDEPLQECVFLRYFEGLAPRAVAARVGVPVAVVYVRLRTARERLRAALGERDLDWQRRLGLLCGLGPRALPFDGSRAPADSPNLPNLPNLPILPLLPGVLLMTLNKKLVLAACAVTALLLFGLAPSWFGSGAGPIAAGDATGAARASDVAPRSAVLGEDVRDREPVAESADIPELAGVSLPHAYEVVFHVHDDHELPVSGASILLGPALHDLNRVGETGDDGTLTVRWRARTPSMAVTWGTHGSTGLELCRATVDAGRVASFAARGRSGRVGGGWSTSVVRLRAVGVTGAPSGAEGPVRFELVESGNGSPPKARRDEHGWTWFATRSRGRPDRQPLAFGFLDGSIHNFEFQVFHQVTAKADSDGDADAGELRPPARLRGVVRDARGEPVAGALVVVGPRSDRRSPWQATTGQDGTFEIEGIAAGEWFVRAGGGEHGLAIDRVVLAPGDAAVWNGRLDRGEELRGRLTDEVGQALAGWRVEARSITDGAPWVDLTTADGAGRFALPNLRSADYALSVWPPQPGATLPVWTAGPFQPDGVERAVVVPAEQARLGNVVFSGRIGAGGPSWSWRAQLWRAGDGRGVEASCDGEGRCTFERLAPGDYRLEIGGVGVAWTEVARFRVLPAAETDLGVVAVEAPSAVDIEPAQDGAATDGAATDGAATSSIWSLHPDVVSSVFRGEVGDATSVFAPAGEILWRRGGGPIRRVALEPGGRVALVPRD